MMLEKQYKGITGNNNNKLSDNLNIENSDSNSDSINEYLSEAIMLEKQYKGVTDTEENHNVGNENERVFLKEKSEFKKFTNNVELYSHPICSMNSKNEVPIYEYMSLKESNEKEEKFIPVSTKKLIYENLPLFNPSPIINSDRKNNLTLITSENYTDFIDVVNSSQENKNPCHPIATEETKTNSSDHETCGKSCEYNSLKFDDVIFKDLYKTPIAKHSESFEMFLKERERKLSEICDTSLLSTEERLESEKIRQKNLSVDRRETFCHYPNKINKIKYPILRKEAQIVNLISTKENVNKQKDVQNLSFKLASEKFDKFCKRNEEKLNRNKELFSIPFSNQQSCFSSKILRHGDSIEDIEKMLLEKQPQFKSKSIDQKGKIESPINSIKIETPKKFIIRKDSSFINNSFSNSSSEDALSESKIVEQSLTDKHFNNFPDFKESQNKIISLKVNEDYFENEESQIERQTLEDSKKANPSLFSSKPIFCEKFEIIKGCIVDIDNSKGVDIKKKESSGKDKIYKPLNKYINEKLPNFTKTFVRNKGNNIEHSSSDSCDNLSSSSENDTEKHRLILSNRTKKFKNHSFSKPKTFHRWDSSQHTTESETSCSTNNFNKDESTDYKEFNSMLKESNVTSIQKQIISAESKVEGKTYYSSAESQEYINSSDKECQNKNEIIKNNETELEIHSSTSSLTISSSSDEDYKSNNCKNKSQTLPNQKIENDTAFKEKSNSLTKKWKEGNKSNTYLVNEKTTIETIESSSFECIETWSKGFSVKNKLLHKNPRIAKESKSIPQLSKNPIIHPTKPIIKELRPIPSYLSPKNVFRHLSSDEELESNNLFYKQDSKDDNTNQTIVQQFLLPELIKELSSTKSCYDYNNEKILKDKKKLKLTSTSNTLYEDNIDSCNINDTSTSRVNDKKHFNKFILDKEVTTNNKDTDSSSSFTISSSSNHSNDLNKQRTEPEACEINDRSYTISDSVSSMHSNSNYKEISKENKKNQITRTSNTKLNNERNIMSNYKHNSSTTGSSDYTTSSTEDSYSSS